MLSLKFRQTMSFISNMYKMELQPKIPIPRADVVSIVDKLIKSNEKKKGRFDNVKVFLTHYDEKTSKLHLKVVAINIRTNSSKVFGTWGYLNSQFVRQNGLFITEWFNDNEISNYYTMNIKRVYTLSTEWRMDESTETQFEDLNYYDTAKRIVEYSKDNKFWDKYHNVKIKNKRYFDISLSNFMYTFNMNISDYLYKYRWKTFEDLNREFPIDFYKKKISGFEMKSLVDRAEFELSRCRKDNELVTFTKMLTLRGLFNVSTAEWSIINHKIKYYNNEEDFDMVRYNNHYSSYENDSKDIIDRYLWLSDLFNFTGMDNILLKGV